MLIAYLDRWPPCSRASAARDLLRSRFGASVQTPLQITFRGIEPSTAIEDYVRRRATKLETFYDRITGCHVTVEAPNHHHKQGRQYRILIDLVVPKAELVVGRAPDEGSSHEDVYAAIDDAFDDAGRVLQDHVGKQRAR